MIKNTILGFFMPLFLFLEITGLVMGSSAKDQTISYMDAASYEGQVKTVKMPVSYAFYEQGKEYFFSSRVAPHHAHLVPEGGDKSGFFTVSIPKDYFDLFPDGFDKLVKNREVLVTGEIGWYHGDPHIVVTSPDQIEILN